MNQPTLYLFVGYPGAGKTTVAKMIQKHTGAYHLWADKERHAMFPNPSHSKSESTILYEHLNAETARMLGEGTSVIFDTNFNFIEDRHHLRHIASEMGAKTVLIWIDTPYEDAKYRAVHSGQKRNGYDAAMTESEFDSIAGKLEIPQEDELPIKIDGTKLDESKLMQQLSQ